MCMIIPGLMPHSFSEVDTMNGFLSSTTRVKKSVSYKFGEDPGIFVYAAPTAFIVLSLIPA